MKEIDKYNWNSISGDKYWEIVDILNNPDASEMQKQAELIALIEDKSVDEILSLDMSSAAELINKLEFLNKFELSKRYHPSSIIIDNKKYNVYPNLANLNVAQFIDYQSFIAQPFRESYDKILSIFLIPDGHEYNSGYDILEVQEVIRTKLSWLEIQNLLNFILVKYVKSYMRIQAYLTKKVRKEKDPQKKDTLMKKLETMIQAKNQLVNLACSASCV